MKLLFSILAIAIAATASQKSVQEYLTDGNEMFTVRLHSEVTRQNPDRSVVLSGFSVLCPLALLTIASTGVTHDELLEVMSLPNDNVTMQAFGEINKKMKSIKGVTLKMANKIYVAGGYTLNDKFATISRDVFNSEVQNIDFTESVKSAKEINAWVENHTNNRIKDLVEPDSLSSDSRALLVNAIYFKGSWKQPFPKITTLDRTFFITKNKSVKIPMMFQTGTFLYGESKELNAKLVELMYEGDEASFLVVLPNDIEGLPDLQRKLGEKSLLKKAESEMQPIEIELLLPKFKIETTTDLREALINMNVKSLFDSGAQLSNLLKEESQLYVSKAIQKAFIEVNEEGAEAAAANGVVVDDYSAFNGPLFLANKPFYFALKLKGSEKLFTGVFMGDQ